MTNTRYSWPKMFTVYLIIGNNQTDLDYGVFSKKLTETLQNVHLMKEEREECKGAVLDERMLKRHGRS